MSLRDYVEMDPTAESLPMQWRGVSYHESAQEGGPHDRGEGRRSEVSYCERSPSPFGV